jgi:Na+-translocating ferredoxin:NAD+ oxidoreductase RNF subunit RnfB
MSKGSRPRPYSVSQDTFANNYDAIFGKKDKMSPSVEQMKKGTCGCGRSPTGDCIGWHSLTEEMYQHKKMLWLEEQEVKDNEVKDSTQGG